MGPLITPKLPSLFPVTFLLWDLPCVILAWPLRFLFLNAPLVYLFHLFCF